MIAQLKSFKAEGCTVHGVGQHGGVVFQIEEVVVNAMAGLFYVFRGQPACLKGRAVCLTARKEQMHTRGHGGFGADLPL